MVLKWCNKHKQWYNEESESESKTPYIDKLLSEPRETAASKLLRKGKSVTQMFGGVY